MASRGEGRLAGRVAIITGAGTLGGGVGIGKAISLRFAREGASVALVDLDADRAAETVREVEAEGGTAFAIEGDVSLSGDCERVVTEAVERFGRLDILVNNAAFGGGDDTEETWDKVLAVNLKGPKFMSAMAAPHMAAAGGGAIVNISSIAATVATGRLPAYAASKAGLNSLTRTMALQYASDGIRVNTVAPGAIETPLAARHGGLLPPEIQKKIIPIGRSGTPWDIASATLFFASDDAAYVTGACLPVDGGITAISPHVIYSRLIAEQS